jgi:hypothetical protein
MIFCYAQDEAKDAFKELLAAMQVASDWSWDKTMRHIISDPRRARTAQRSLLQNIKQLPA